MARGVGGGVGGQLGSSQRLQMAPEPSFCLGPAQSSPRREAPHQPGPAHVEEEAGEHSGPMRKPTHEAINVAGT